MSDPQKSLGTDFMIEDIDQVIETLGDWLESVDYRGNDPYQLDNIITKTASRPLIGPVIGMARKLLKPYHSLIPKRLFSASPPILMPQALGDALSGEGFRKSDQQAKRRAEALFTLIKKTRSPLSRYSAWGLPFSWGGTEAHQTDWPTTISTTFVLNGLLNSLHLLDREEVIPILESAIDFFMYECGVEETGKGSFLRYGPGDTRLILNASAAAAVPIMRIGEICQRDELIDFAHRASRFVASHQNPDGSWYFAPQHGPHALDTIIDSRHTGYIIEAVATVNNLVKDPALEVSIDAGWNYVKTFLLEDNKPRWSPEQTWPLDSYDVAQLILTSLTLEEMDLATSTVELAINEFHRGDGLFRYKLFENGRSNDAVFIRWTQAPMYVALSRYRKEL